MKSDVNNDAISFLKKDETAIPIDTKQSPKIIPPIYCIAAWPKSKGAVKFIINVKGKVRNNMIKTKNA